MDRFDCARQDCDVWQRRGIAVLARHSWLLLCLLALLVSACGSMDSTSQSPTTTAAPRVNGFGTAANHVHAMLALPDHTLVLATHYGLFRSIDDGKQWSGPDKTLNDMMTSSLSSSLLNRQRIYVLAEHSLSTQSGGVGLYVSSDAGVSWKMASSVTETGKMYTIAAGNRSANEVYAYVPTRGANGLLVSQDGGQHFSSPGSLPFGRILGILPLPARPGQLLVFSNDGVARSTDAGAHWTVVNSFSSSVYNMTTGGPDSTIYASGDQGIFASNDGGKSFKLVDKNVYYTGLAAVPGQPQMVYGKTGRLIYKSSDGGYSWKALPQVAGNLENLVPDPQSSTHLFLSLSYPSGVALFDQQSAAWSSLTPRP
ncbi:sialidase family protein [Dictyobacter arantiisoli]|uniref:Sortilin N-terminal domain-containing protein n=1 Tax=Dictyobacter arantiisoli TaxID=2014874 RepID=A0A5A5T5U8_9CHLR|nr:sialidase family protein [Dictyobacter arantiisoli]GCF06595.1 hypothetical protein KDI_01590 [Dictyobacter arantiisoli]